MMRLGLHTYSLYLHGLGQDWAWFEPPWERQLGAFQLFDLGLGGLGLGRKSNPGDPPGALSV